MKDAEKLQILLEHWIEHNLAHREEFARWAQRAWEVDLAEVAGFISRAAASLEEVNRHLREALARLGEKEIEDVPE